MPTTNSSFSREVIQFALEHRSGSVPTPFTIAEATFSIWRQMSARLVPVIGEQGVAALVRRSLHLSRSVFSWTAVTKVLGDSTDLSVSLMANLTGRDANDVTETNCTILATFIDMLKSLIGEPLTVRLLASVLVCPPPTAGSKNPTNEQQCTRSLTHYSCIRARYGHRPARRAVSSESWRTLKSARASTAMR